jgi:hypothetical protein
VKPVHNLQDAIKVSQQSPTLGTEQYVKDVVDLTVPHLVQHVHEVAIDRSSVLG